MNRIPYVHLFHVDEYKSSQGYYSFHSPLVLILHGINWTHESLRHSLKMSTYKESRSNPESLCGFGEMSTLDRWHHTCYKTHGALHCVSAPGKLQGKKKRKHECD